MPARRTSFARIARMLVTLSGYIPTTTLRIEKKGVTMTKQARAVIKAPIKIIMRRFLLHFLNLKNA